MNFTALGGGSCIGGSCYVLRIGDKTLVCDCGIAFNKGVPTLPDLSSLQEIHAIFATHCHLDHIGALPHLAKQHPHALIFGTGITKQLTAIVLTDNLNFARRSGNPTYYTEADLNDLLSRMQAINHTEWFSPWPDIAIRLWPAGHIPGACSILIKTQEQSVMFSGDLSIYGDAVVQGAAVPEEFYPDVLITEATNGHLKLPSRQTEEEKLCSLVSEVKAHGGHVLIPALAVGRAPQIALTLARAGLPVTLGGGLAIRVAETYGVNHQNIRFLGKNEDILRALIAIAEAPEPQVIVCTQGMLEGGVSRDLVYLFAEDPRHAIILPGFQAEGTTGERISHLHPGQVFIFPERTPQEKVIHARVTRFFISSHPDGPQLTSWIQTLNPKLAIMTHGTSHSFRGLKGRLENAGLPGTVVVGENLKEIPC